MAHTPTNWQNYPATVTPITASELNRMDGLLTAAYDLAELIINKIVSPETVITETLDAQSTLVVSSFYVFPSSVTVTDVSTDGIIIRKNNTIVPPSSYTVAPATRMITFTGIEFEDTDTVTFSLYRPAAITPTVICTQTEYDNMQTHDDKTLYVIIEEAEP